MLIVWTSEETDGSVDVSVDLAEDSDLNRFEAMKRELLSPWNTEATAIEIISNPDKSGLSGWDLIELFVRMDTENLLLFEHLVKRVFAMGRDYEEGRQRKLGQTLEQLLKRAKNE